MTNQIPRRLNNRRVWIHLAWDTLLWMGLLISRLELSPSVIFTVARSIVFVILSLRSFGLMHDCAHSAGHDRRKTNDRLGAVFGVLCFLPFGRWKKLHLEHHTWTGNVDRDPSMKILARFRDHGHRVPRFVTVSWRFWIPTLGLLQHVVFWSATLNRESYVFLMALAGYLGLATWIIGPTSLLLGLALYFLAVEVVNFPHHLGLKQFSGESRFPVYEQHRFTRSCLYPKWFAHFVLKNFNLHNEHHLVPTYPWYQLDDIHHYLQSQPLRLNTCVNNQWISENRNRPVNQIFEQTFTDHSDQAAALGQFK